MLQLDIYGFSGTFLPYTRKETGWNQNHQNILMCVNDHVRYNMSLPYERTQPCTNEHLKHLKRKRKRK